MHFKDECSNPNWSMLVKRSAGSVLYHVIKKGLTNDFHYHDSMENII